VAPGIVNAVQHRAQRFDAGAKWAKQKTTDHGHISMTLLVVFLFHKNEAIEME
jgi:hypothetical protein